jgi:parvulin-like peptidyl-prolyl isomerase
VNWSKFKTKKFYIPLISILFLLIVVLPFALYFYNPSAKLTRSIFSVIPYPVAIVDGKNFITTRTLLADTEAVRNFYENQDFSSSGKRVDFSTKEGQMRLKIKEKEVLDKLIEDVIIKKASQKRGITVSEKEADNKIASLIDEEGSLEIFKDNLKKSYGWELDYFRDRVIVSQLYLEKLVDYYIEEEETSTER